MLREAGIDFSSCSLSNVFPWRPPDNDEEYFCIPKAELPEGYSLPPLVTHPKNLYVDPKYLGELARVRSEIEQVKPNIVIALGKTALWALTQRTDLGSARGVYLPSSLVPGYKVIASHHPARVLREWSLRVIAIADFVKAARGSHSKLLEYDRTEIWINPNLSDLAEFERRYFTHDRPIAADIETFGGLIRCVGFAPSPAHSICVPFYSPSGPYWENRETEAMAWGWVRKILSQYQITFHNGGYDISYFFRYGIVPKGYRHDTMLLHHALYPELKKSLEFLGSYLANRPSWKKLRPRGGKRAKREE